MSDKLLPMTTRSAVTDTGLDSDERDENLVVLYDDMKLAFNGLLSQILAGEVSEEAYIELTLQVSEFSYRLDHCMGLDPEKADTRYSTSQEQDRTWSSQLAHDKRKYMRPMVHIKKLLSRNKPSESSWAGSLISRGTGWWKSRTVGQVDTRPSASKISGSYICDCCPKKPKKFDNRDELR